MKKNIFFVLMVVFTKLTCVSAATPSGLEGDSRWCSREILMVFFPKPIVESILMKHHIEQHKATAIADMLSHKDSEIIQIIEAKSVKMRTEPPIEVNRREAAVQLFKEALYEVFSNTLIQNGVKESEADVRSLMDEVQETKGKLFVKCVQAKHLK